RWRNVNGFSFGDTHCSGEQSVFVSRERQMSSARDKTHSQIEVTSPKGFTLRHARICRCTCLYRETDPTSPPDELPQNKGNDARPPVCIKQTRPRFQTIEFNWRFYE